MIFRPYRRKRRLADPVLNHAHDRTWPRDGDSITHPAALQPDGAPQRIYEIGSHEPHSGPEDG